MTKVLVQFSAGSESSHSNIRSGPTRGLLDIRDGAFFHLQHSNDETIFRAQGFQESLHQFSCSNQVSRMWFVGRVTRYRVQSGRLFLRQIGHPPFRPSFLSANGVKTTIHRYSRNPMTERDFASVLVQFLEHL